MLDNVPGGIGRLDHPGDAMPHSSDAATPDPSHPGPLYSRIENPLGRTYLRLLARPDGLDMVYRISGSVYADAPGDTLAPTLRHGTRLFGFEGYNIRRFHRDAGTDRLWLLTREIVFYTDPAAPTTILPRWTNPLDGRTYPVVPVNNASVSQGPFTIGEDFTGPPPHAAHGTLNWRLDIPPRTDLGATLGEEFGLAEGIYTSWELFDFQVEASEVDRSGSGDRIPKGAMPVTSSWTRTGPVPPFMGIAESQARVRMVYHTRNWSLDGFADIEPWLQEAVESDYPLYTAAPDAPGPNVTSWSSFWADQLGEGTITWAEWCEANGEQGS
jgi:hypothetical protein